MCWSAVISGLRVVCLPVHLKRTLLIALVVGSWLNLFNHADALLLGRIDAHLGFKLAPNFLTPFVVANIGVLARKTPPDQGHGP